MTDQIFTIYSRRDLNIVRSLSRDLEGSGYTVWIDVDMFAPGATVRSMLGGALAASAAALLVHSWEWIYDPRFECDDLRLILDVANAQPVCPPVVGIRIDDAPLPASVRTIPWAGLYKPSARPDLATAIRNATKDPNRGSALAALDALVASHDEPSRRLRVHLRQHWGHSINLMSKRAYAEVVDIWRPVFEVASFRSDHPRWTDEPTIRCAIHGTKSLLFQASAALGQKYFDEYVPLAYRFLRDLVTTEPFSSVTDGELIQLSADTATTQNLNYLDTVEVALDWSQGWDPSVLRMFGIPKDESTEVFALAARRVVQLRAALGTDA